MAAEVPGGRLVAVGDTRLHVVERGTGPTLLVLHGGPGLDHTMFGDYLDPLADRYRLVLVDQRSHGRSDPAPESTWSLAQMAADVSALATALGAPRYAVLGHSYGAFVALQHAVDFPGAAACTIVSSGVGSARWLEAVDRNLAAFEPAALRAQVTESWARERDVLTQDDVAAGLHDQLPFHFADPLDPRIAEYEARCPGAIYAPAVLRHFAQQEYGDIEVEDRLASVPQPVLVLAGRADRTCVLPGAEALATGLPHGELVVFEQSGHMTFVEEPERYLAVLRAFLDRHLPA